MSDPRPFGSTYAEAYDTLYAEKDYPGEVDKALRLIEAHGRRPARVLDLGCGTGGHAIELAGRGIDVVGLDRSTEMLDIARAKAAAAGASERLTFHQADLTAPWPIDERFDAAIMMFAVLGYLTTNDGLVAALSHVADALEPGGVLVFDAWYGPAVLRDRPGDRERTVTTADGGTIRRSTRATLDIQQQTVRVAFDVERRDARGARATHEEHLMRFFFAHELTLLCRLAGLELVTLAPFDAPEQAMSEETWIFIAAARRPRSVS